MSDPRPATERIETAIELVKGYLTALNHNDYEGVVKLTSDDFEIIPVIIGKPMDRDHYLALHQEADGAFPDLRRHVESIEGEVEGDDVIVEAKVRVTATNERTIDLPMLGIGPLPPTGLKLEPPAHHDFFTVRDDLIRTYRSELPEGGGFKGMIETIEAELAKRDGKGEQG